MSSFVTPLVVSPLASGRRWRLFLPFTYHRGSKRSNKIIKVPKGFDTDFASIPKFLWLFPCWAKFNKPSPLHDWLYQTKQIMGKPITRKEADRIFYEAMLVAFRKHKSGRLIAFIEYWSVRLFGQLAWFNAKPYLIKNSKPQRGQRSR